MHHKKSLQTAIPAVSFTSLFKMFEGNGTDTGIGTGIEGDESAAPKGLCRVKLNIYEPIAEGKRAIYSSAVEVEVENGLEFLFIEEEPSRLAYQSPGRYAALKELKRSASIDVGITKMSSFELRSELRKLQKTEFGFNSFHPIMKNSYHFSDRFCRAITVENNGIPGWINTNTIKNYDDYSSTNPSLAVTGPPGSSTANPIEQCGYIQRNLEAEVQSRADIVTFENDYAAYEKRVCWYGTPEPSLHIVPDVEARQVLPMYKRINEMGFRVTNPHEFLHQVRKVIAAKELKTRTRLSKLEELQDRLEKKMDRLRKRLKKRTKKAALFNELKTRTRLSKLEDLQDRLEKRLGKLHKRLKKRTKKAALFNGDGTVTLGQMSYHYRKEQGRWVTGPKPIIVKRMPEAGSCSDTEEEDVAYDGVTIINGDRFVQGFTFPLGGLGCRD